MFVSRLPKQEATALTKLTIADIQTLIGIVEEAFSPKLNKEK